MEKIDSKREEEKQDNRTEEKGMGEGKMGEMREEKWSMNRGEHKQRPIKEK